MRGVFLVAVCAFLVIDAGTSSAAEPVELRVMTFNVWYGGDQVSIAQVGEAIRAANADIVGLQEADRNLMRIAEAAGMPFVDTRRRILSRWPIFDSGSGERTDTGPAPYSITALDRDALHAWVMVQPGRVVAVSNVHLSSSPSGLGAVRAGRSADDVYAMERATRGAEAEPLAALGKLAQRDVPVFLTGDFNSASHLDWTEATHRARPDIPYAFAWPATQVLADAGLRDSYREAYPDPVQRPGFTWSPGAPYPLAEHVQSQNRIDYVLTGGNSRTVSSEIVGEPRNPGVDIAVSPWPSDHRAVVSTFRVVPASAPPMIVATPRRVAQDGVVEVRTWDPSGDTWTALIVRRGGEAGDTLTGVRDMPQNYQRSIPISIEGMEAGNYDVILVGEDGASIARDGFTIASPGATPQIEVMNPVVASGDAIRARWHDSPGDLRDWIGLYRAGEVDISRYLAFVYTEAAFDGQVDVPTVSTDEGAPDIEAGEYELRLLHDESFVVLARSKVTIQP